MTRRVTVPRGAAGAPRTAANARVGTRLRAHAERAQESARGVAEEALVRVVERRAELEEGTTCGRDPRTRATVHTSVT